MVDELLASLEPVTERQLRELLFPDPDDAQSTQLELARPSLQLPLIFITEYALARLWMSWGVRPDALIAIGDAKPDAKLDPVELASWTMIANLILNLDEVVTK